MAKLIGKVYELESGDEVIVKNDGGYEISEMVRHVLGKKEQRKIKEEIADAEVND